MSHLKTHLENLVREIRSPLSFVLGATERLLDSSLSTEERKSLERLKASGELFRQATEEIFSRSRLEGQDVKFEPAPIRIADGASGAAKSAGRPAAQTPGVSGARRAAENKVHGDSKTAQAAEHHRAARTTARTVGPRRQHESSDRDMQPVFNRDATLERIDGDERLLDEMIEIFRHDATRRMDRIRDSIGKRDAKGVAHAAHSLKGAAASLGGELIAEAARWLEEIARKGNLDAAAGAVAQLERELQRFTAAISETPLHARA